MDMAAKVIKLLEAEAEAELVLGCQKIVQD